MDTPVDPHAQEHNLTPHTEPQQSNNAEFFVEGCNLAPRTGAKVTSTVSQSSEVANPALPTENAKKSNFSYDEKPWTLGDKPYKYDIPPMKEGEDPWKTCADLVKKYDDNMISGWKDEIQNLLIFAGLFSSVVTSFTVQSYTELQPDSSDVTNILLAEIATQLGSNSSFVKSFSPESLSSPPSALNVDINIFFFLSLILSLSTVLVGIICLQWLREYSRDVGLDRTKDTVGMRQMRYDGLVAWQVPGVVLALPVILQMALVLFFIGLIQLIWSLDATAAIPVIVITSLTLLFLAVTTAIPAIQNHIALYGHGKLNQCPYKSPQSWMFHALIRVMLYVLLFARAVAVLLVIRFMRLFGPVDESRMRNRYIYTPGQYYTDTIHDLGWEDYDARWYNSRNPTYGDEKTAHDEDSDDTVYNKDAVSALSWIDKTYGLTRIDAIRAITWCIRDISKHARVHIGVPSNELKLISPENRNEAALMFFLEKYAFKYREYLNPYLACVVRILNSDESLIPFPDNGDNVLSDVDYEHVVPNELTAQLLTSFKRLAASGKLGRYRNVRKGHHSLSSILRVITNLLYRGPLSEDQEGIEWNKFLTQSAFEVMDQVALLTRQLIDDLDGLKNLAADSPEEVTANTKGKIISLGSEFDIMDLLWLYAFRIWYLCCWLGDKEIYSQSNFRAWRIEVIRNLNDCIEKLGGPSMVLRRYGGFGESLVEEWSELCRKNIPSSSMLSDTLP